MPQYTCPHCSQPFTATSATSATQVLCPHCKQAVEVPATSASRWFYARGKKKYGPYTWQQLSTLAKRGDLQPDDMLLQEGTKQWVRADSLPALAAIFTPTAVSATPEEPALIAPLAGKSRRSAPRSVPWLIAGLAGAGVCAFLGLAVVIAFFYFRNDRPIGPILVQRDDGRDDKRTTKDEKPKTDTKVIKKDGDAPKTDDKKKKPDDKKQSDPARAKQIEQFVERLNRHRKAAGVGLVTLDADLSRGCQAHAKYLAKHVAPADANTTNVYEEDPQKPGYSTEGEQAGQNAMVAFQDPVNALERWMGRLPSRIPLLNGEVKSIGVGFEKNERGESIVVLDPVRGRGEPIVVFPAPKQSDAPIAFSGGPDVPDSKAAAGFPVSVSFPPGKRVTDAQIALHDSQGKPIAGWLWTPDAPLRPGQKLNALGLIPKVHLESDTLYQVKASAQVDGKPWNLAWSFTTEDDSDKMGIWAKKVLDKVNVYRASAGLKPVALDDAQSQACQKHARYLVINEGHPSLQGLDAHKEDPKLPGYSKEGHEAGMASDIAIGDYEPIDAVDSWMATLYHRVPILEPGLKSIGFGCARGRRQGWATVMNVGTGRDKGTRPHAVFYPAPDQADVPLTFPNSGEEPNPIPEDKDGRAGYPITAFFPQKDPLLKASGTLMNDKGVEVPCWFSTPEVPANPKFARNQGNTVCLIAKDPLVPRTTYHVHLKGTLAGKPWEKKWKFTTIEAGLSTEAATRVVVDRLNAFRAQAGLGAVTLDEVLSRGCQLHSEYLAKNADALIKSKASVNDEDPQLPWFTAEGLRASKQSLVFTNAPTPVMQIDDLMATFTARMLLLDPNLQRVGFGCAHDVGRGWRCVLDPNGGRGDARILLYPAPKQEDVPLLGFDRIDDAKGPLGFPITVTFPQRSVVRNAAASLTDAADGNVALFLSSPEKPLNAKQQRNTIGVHPLEPLQAGKSYAVTVSAVVNGKEWRQSWQFTTAK